MPDRAHHLLLDQNIPEEITGWLREKSPGWRISHVKEIGLAGRPDPEIFLWAQTNNAIVVTYD